MVIPRIMETYEDSNMSDSTKKITTDRNDPRLTSGVDTAPIPQAAAYLVLSEEERAKGFVRPVRTDYIHTGYGPEHPLRDLTEEEMERFSGTDYSKYETYPTGGSLVGRYWKLEQLEAKGCGGMTVMGIEIAETYARDPSFYGSTYCFKCEMHRPVAEFRWASDGTVVGS